MRRVLRTPLPRSASAVALAWATCAVGTLGTLPACDLASRKPVDAEAALSLPSKDEVAMIDGKPLSIGAFLAIRSTEPNASRETALWLGLAAIALQNDSRARGHEISPVTALSLAKFAAGLAPRSMIENEIREYLGAKAVAPDAVTFKSEVDALLARAVIHRNDHALSDLR